MRIQNQIKTLAKWLKEHIELLLLVLFFFTLPLKNSYNSISILLLLVYSFKNWKLKNFNKFKIYYAQIGYFLIASLSLLYSDNIYAGRITLLGHSIFLVFPFIFLSLKFKSENLKKALNFFICWICLLALYSEITSIWNLLDRGESLFLLFRKDHSYKTLGHIISIHPPYMSLFSSYCILLLVSKIGSDVKQNIKYVVLIFFLLFYTIHLSSRLPILALLIVGSLFSFITLSQRYTLKKTFLQLFISFGIVLVLLMSVRSTRYRFAEIFGMEYSSGLYIKSGPAKLEQWSAAVSANNNVFIGNGIGDANETIRESNINSGLVKNVNRKYNAHNQYIQSYVGLGLIGLILLFWMLLYCWDKEKPLTKLNNYFLIYLAIVFLSESYLQRHHGIVFIAFILCVIRQQKFVTKNLVND